MLFFNSDLSCFELLAYRSWKTPWHKCFWIIQVHDAHLRLLLGVSLLVLLHGLLYELLLGELLLLRLRPRRLCRRHCLYLFCGLLRLQLGLVGELYHVLGYDIIVVLGPTLKVQL